MNGGANRRGVHQQLCVAEVLAVEAVFIGASNELGAFESGITAEWFGLVPAIVVSGLATLVIVGLFAFCVPDLRKLDRFNEITSETGRPSS